jgi:DedD protein
MPAKPVVPPPEPRSDAPPLPPPPAVSANPQLPPAATGSQAPPGSPGHGATGPAEEPLAASRSNGDADTSPPLKRDTGAAEQTAVAPASSARTVGFVVQAGVFGETQNAQALQAKLRENGVAATLETRVIVGPFRDRAEADAAQRRMRRLGVEGIVAQRK